MGNRSRAGTVDALHFTLVFETAEYVVQANRIAQSLQGSLPLLVRDLCTIPGHEDICKDDCVVLPLLNGFDGLEDAPVICFARTSFVTRGGKNIKNQQIVASFSMVRYQSANVL